MRAPEPNLNIVSFSFCPIFQWRSIWFPFWRWFREKRNHANVNLSLCLLRYCNRMNDITRLVVCNVWHFICYFHLIRAFKIDVHAIDYKVFLRCSIRNPTVERVFFNLFVFVFVIEFHSEHGLLCMEPYNVLDVHANNIYLWMKVFFFFDFRWFEAFV